jgi:hypothetical protein
MPGDGPDDADNEQSDAGRCVCGSWSASLQLGCHPTLFVPYPPPVFLVEGVGDGTGNRGARPLLSPWLRRRSATACCSARRLRRRRAIGCDSPRTRAGHVGEPVCDSTVRFAVSLRAGQGSCASAANQGGPLDKSGRQQRGKVADGAARVDELQIADPEGFGRHAPPRDPGGLPLTEPTGTGRKDHGESDVGYGG